MEIVSKIKTVKMYILMTHTKSAMFVFALRYRKHSMQDTSPKYNYV